MRDRICIDVDGVLAQSVPWQGVDHFGELIPGVKEFLDSLGEKYEIIIHTCRCTEGINGPEKGSLLASRVRAWLEQNNLPYDHIWTEPGKPIAAYYIDDRGISCQPETDPESFQRILSSLL